MSSKVYVPSHITGFFNIEHNVDPLKNGSCGAGLLLNKGVKTLIKSTHKDETTILINGKVDKTKEGIINEVLKLLNIDYPIKIVQEIDIPIGCGFGSSAGQALGVAINLTDDFIKAGKIAHTAEVNLGSGLGDVIAQTGQGLVLRTRAGAPGVGEIESFPYDNIFIGCKSLGDISTSSIIKDYNYRKIISNYGVSAKNRFLKDKSLENFLKLSYNFSNDINLMSEELSTLINSLNINGDILGASMAMLGETVFALSYDKCVFDNDFDVYKMDNDGIKL